MSEVRTIIIDPAARTVEEARLPTDYRSLQSVVGGSIEVACDLRNGDVLYVCEDGIAESGEAMEGLLEAAKACCFDIGAHQPFMGKGIIVGAEVDGMHGPALTSVDEIRARIEFMQPLVMSADRCRPQ